MANQNNLGIRITADLKRNESIDEINKSLRFIEGKIQKLDIGANFDGLAKQFNKQVNKMNTSKAKDKMDDLVEVPVEKIRKENEKLSKAIDGIQENFNGKLKSIRVVEGREGIDKAVVSLKDYNNQLTKTITLSNHGLHNKETGVRDDKFVETLTEEYQDLEKVMKESQKEADKLEKEFESLQDAQEKYIKNY